MNVRKLAEGLTYVGEVNGKRQTYYVFRGGEDFLVLSFSRTKPKAGNFNIVDSEAVEYVRSRFAGARGVTTNDVVAKAKRTRRVRDNLAALNVLYVLAALGDLKIDARHSDPKLYFNFRSRRA